jgi:hypothetical protein
LVAAVFVGGCLQIGLPGITDGDPVALDAGPASDGAVATDVKTANVDAGVDRGCVVDPLSHATLCTSIALCPGLAIDHDQFPDCGFRTGSGLIDIECVCDNYLCPLGTTLTCAQAHNLLASQFEVLACTQVSEGRCAPRSVVAPSDSWCDETCRAACTGVPRCMRACGC